MKKTFLAITIVSFSLAYHRASAQELSTSPKAKAYMVGYAHLDTQWNWDVQTTINEYLPKTLRQNFYLFNNYPNYIFNFEGGVRYSWMKEYYPLEYEKMKQYIQQGRWNVCGSCWEATDVLVPSVESLIRNTLLGQMYYRKEFGVESTDILLPDCFGFGWTLPTVASHCGLIGFSSQKLDWRTNPFYGKEKYPFTIGLWRGVDGKDIMFAHGYDVGKRWDYADLSQDKELLSFAKRSPLNIVYRYYGTGDTGGSPTIGSVASIEKGMQGNGALEIISAPSDQLFKEYLPFSNHPELPVFDGELLMDVHGVGCYTSQAAMKLYNRQNELLGDAAERASVAAEVLGAIDYPREELTKSWQRVILHQFHDDLTGTSIPRAYEFSWNDELLSLKSFSSILTTAVGNIAQSMDTRVHGLPVVFYNMHDFDATDIVEIEISSPNTPHGISVYNEKGQKVRSQIVDYKNGKVRLLVEATIPATGISVYDVRFSNSGNNKMQELAKSSIENSIYKLSLNKQGDIVSLYDKRVGKELVKPGKTIRLALFDSNELSDWPAWEISKSTLDSTPISITDNVSMRVIEDNSLRKTLLVEKSYNQSVFRQFIRLYEGELAPRIDFYNEVDWLSENSLLKAEFPLNLNNEKATYDLGLGSIQRGNNTKTAYEVYGHRWADLTDNSGEYGISILNDCKYGWDKPDNNTLRLTLLYTPKTEKRYPYQNKQDFGHHIFTYSIVGHKGLLDKSQTNRKADLLNQRIQAFVVNKHPGNLGKMFSLVASNNPNVAINALKKAEDSDEYVVRVYETGGEKDQSALLSFSKEIISAVQADGTEKTICDAKFDGNGLHVKVGRNGISTYKIRLNKDKKSQSAYEYLHLKHNVKSFTNNAFANAGNFHLDYSYAAELLPTDSIIVSGIPFCLKTKEEYNGMRCEGEVLDLPAGHSFNRLYLLAAAATAEKDVTESFEVGNEVQRLTVPSYTGFVGQWGHKGHTDGYLKDAEVAHVGTHRHSSNGDHPFEFTYIYKFSIDIPKGATKVVLPDNRDLVLFAATLVDEQSSVKAVSQLFSTSNK